MRASEEKLRALIISGLDGDAGSHAALLHALVPVLQDFYRRRMGDVDVDYRVQETLIAVRTRRVTYDRARPFTAWLFSIARYKIVDHFRRSQRLEPIAVLEDILVAEGFKDKASSRLNDDQLAEILPPKQARAIRAIRLKGLRTTETVKREANGQFNLKVSVHRGLKSLVTSIREWGR